MQSSWRAVALLHPFSPPPSATRPDTPFFQLCVATIEFQAGRWLSIQVQGQDHGTWWYLVTPGETRLSTDQGAHWQVVDMGWSLPSNWFGARSEQAICAGSSPLNWMRGPTVDWWKVPVPVPKSPPAATWMWFASNSGAPVRMMFGYGPPKPDMGDPDQLAFFQMYSFTYLPVFEVLAPSAEPPRWSPRPIPGFTFGNPGHFQNFTWNGNFGMTAFMTPVNENYDPLPTRILYVWKPDDRYAVFSDRAQHTNMLYDYNGGNISKQVALLTGRPPEGTPPPRDSDEGFLINYYRGDGRGPSVNCSCIGGDKFPFPQEPPDWVSVPAVGGRIQATITDNPVLCPGQTVTVFSVLFPPAPPNYPEATYLWTWYSPLNPTGTRSRPVTFMQSQSGVGVGTSLALADYYYYEEFANPVDPSNFAVPGCCSAQTRRLGDRRSAHYSSAGFAWSRTAQAIGPQADPVPG